MMCLYGTCEVDFVLSLLNKHALHIDFLSAFFRVFTGLVLVNKQLHTCLPWTCTGETAHTVFPLDT